MYNSVKPKHRVFLSYNKVQFKLVPNKTAKAAPPKFKTSPKIANPNLVRMRLVPKPSA